MIPISTGPSILHTTGGGSGASSVTSLSPAITTVTPGNLVVVSACFMGGSPGTLSITDSASQTWVAANTDAIGITNQVVLQWYFANSAAITAFTLHSSAACDISCQFYEVENALTSGVLDIHVNSGTAGATASTAPTVTAGGNTAQANEIAFGVIGTEGGPYTIGSVTAGWTAQTPIETTAGYSMMFPFYKVLSTIQTLTLAGTLSSSTRWADCLATFK